MYWIRAAMQSNWKYLLIIMPMFDILFRKAYPKSRIQKLRTCFSSQFVKNSKNISVNVKFISKILLFLIYWFLMFPSSKVRAIHLHVFLTDTIPCNALMAISRLFWLENWKILDDPLEWWRMLNRVPPLFFQLEKSTCVGGRSKKRWKNRIQGSTIYDVIEAEITMNHISY